MGNGQIYFLVINIQRMTLNIPPKIDKLATLQLTVYVTGLMHNITSLFKFEIITHIAYLDTQRIMIEVSPNGQTSVRAASGIQLLL